MSIYATIFELKFPRPFEGIRQIDLDAPVDSDPDEWIDVYGQAVPSHIDYVGGIWDWLPPPVAEDSGLWRAVFVCGPRTTKGTKRNGQKYVNPLLMLTGAEYRAISWRDMLARIEAALWRHGEGRTYDGGTQPVGKP